MVMEMRVRACLRFAVILGHMILVILLMFLNIYLLSKAFKLVGFSIL